MDAYYSDNASNRSQHAPVLTTLYTSRCRRHPKASEYFCALTKKSMKQMTHAHIRTKRGDRAVTVWNWSGTSTPIFAYFGVAEGTSGTLYIGGCPHRKKFFRGILQADYPAKVKAALSCAYDGHHIFSWVNDVFRPSGNPICHNNHLK